MRQRRTDTHTHIHTHRQMFLSPTYSSCWHLLRSSLSLSCSLHSTTLHSLMSRDSQSDEETTNSQSETLLNVKLQEMAAKNGDDVVPTVVNWMAANSAGLSLSLCLSLSATLSALLPLFSLNAHTLDPKAMCITTELPFFWSQFSSYHALPVSACLTPSPHHKCQEVEVVVREENGDRRRRRQSVVLFKGIIRERDVDADTYTDTRQRERERERERRRHRHRVRDLLARLRIFFCKTLCSLWVALSPVFRADSQLLGSFPAVHPRFYFPPKKRAKRAPPQNFIVSRRGHKKGGVDVWVR